MSISVATDNKLQIRESLSKLAEDLNLDPSFLEAIVEIVLNEFNPA